MGHGRRKYRSFSRYRVPGCRSHAAQHGSALVIVLWVVTLLSVIAGSFSLAMRRDSGVVRNLMEAVRARQLTEAGVRHAMLELLNLDAEDAWQPDGTVYPVPIEGTQVMVSLRDESGKVDINAAPGPLLDGVLKAIGVAEDLRPILVDAILDWRDPSETHRLHGPSEADYRQAGYEYGPANAPFQDIQELRLVYGMTPALYNRLAPWITVYSGRDGINVEYAPAGLLRALPGVGEAQVAAYLERREHHRAQGLPAPAFAEADGAYLSGGGGVAYSIRSFVQLAGGTEAELDVTVALAEGGGGEIFQILRWREPAVTAKPETDSEESPE